nr:MAG TPA: hypothetical protein [Caudoviricetes sp.]
MKNSRLSAHISFFVSLLSNCISKGTIRLY